MQFQRDVRKGTFVAQRMVNRCVAAGRSNTHSDCVSLFKFPSDAVLRQKWEKQVQRTQTRWKATEHSVLCSDHFTEKCLQSTKRLLLSLG